MVVWFTKKRVVMRKRDNTNDGYRWFSGGVASLLEGKTMTLCLVVQYIGKVSTTSSPSISARR